MPEWEDDGYEILSWCKDMCFTNGPEFVYEAPLETKMELAKLKADLMYHNKLDLENRIMTISSMKYDQQAHLKYQEHTGPQKIVIISFIRC